MSVTYGAGGSTREKTIEIVKRITRASTGSRRWRTSPAWGRPCRELRATLDEMQRGGDRQRARAARRSAGRPGDVDEDRGRPRVLARAGRADRRRLPVRDRRRLLPRDPHPRRRAPRRTSNTSSRRCDAGVDFLITQLFFDNAAYFDFLERARAAGIDGADHPGHHADHARRARSSGWPRCAAPRSRRRCSASCTRAARTREAVRDFGVAYATLQCAELLAAGAPGHPLLHAQPLARHARDPQRAEARQAVGEGRLPRLDLEPLGHARRAVGGLVAHVHRVVLAVGAHAPGAEQPAPAADLVLAQLALEHERALAHL